MKKLLIVGAGAHGMVIREIVESMQEYRHISFLDDNSGEAIGRCDEYEQFIDEYTHAFVAIGNNDVRADLISKLKEHYEIPKIIHPRAYISMTAKIARGAYVGAMTAVSSNAVIKEGAIVGIGTVIDHHSIIGEYSYVSAGVTVAPMAEVEAFSKIEAGQVVR
jgi:UDP-3-O-[3-hydroxymyristoyl] glucosamine N-acyltransferase